MKPPFHYLEVVNNPETSLRHCMRTVTFQKGYCVCFRVLPALLFAVPKGLPQIYQTRARLQGQEKNGRFRIQGVLY